MSAVLITGTLDEGLQQCIGPFDTVDDAIEYGEIFNLDHYSKFAVDLDEPDDRWPNCSRRYEHARPD